MATPMDIDPPLPVAASNGISNTKKIADVISTYRPTKLFRRDEGRVATITALDFDDEGGLLLTTESDNTLQLYNVKEGKHQDKCISKKYGAANAMFTHSNTGIIYSSTKLNNTIRYYTSHNNTYIRYFEGHTAHVTNLSMHPGNDVFLSCSVDNTMRIWDLESKNASGKLELLGASLSAWDPSGNVFAVGSPPTWSVLLYDFRNFDKAPIATFDILRHCGNLDPERVRRGWNKIEFSNDGKYLLLGTTGFWHLLLDAFSGDLKAILRRTNNGEGAKRLGAGESNPENIDPDSSEFLHPGTGDVCFSSDGRYVISGSRGGHVQVWDTLGQPDKVTNNLYPLHDLAYGGDTGIVAFNPRYNMFATAEKEIVFWVPDPNLSL